jgi:hypothetical protein
MFKKTTFFSMLSLIFILSNTANALEIQINNQSADPGEDISLNITVSDYDQEQIAAAALMLTYNTEQLSLTSVDSDFFATFSDQWNSLDPVPDPLPPTTVQVEGQTYNQPLLFNTQEGSPTGKTLLVGARVKAGTPAIIFTLNFTVSNSAPQGIYPINISPIIMNNTDAGYPAGGESIPIFLGALENQPNPTLAYPAYSPAIINGAVLVNVVITDSDNDSINDQWEIDNFGDLTTADATTDYDNDGYSDLQEYLNSSAAETDPQGNPYDPKTVNAPGGTGYVPISSSSSFWTIMLPVILNGVDK